MSETTTVSIRITTDLLDHIDQSAALAGENRTTYLLSWLPDWHDQTPSTAETHTSSSGISRR